MFFQFLNCVQTNNPCFILGGFPFHTPPSPQAVRADLLRSLLARCELLCEEFDVIEAGKQGSEVYDPPVRLFCHLHAASDGGGEGRGGAGKAGGVEVCDYVFQDEKKEEVRQRIQELLDVEEVTALEETEKSAGLWRLDENFPYSFGR